MHKAYAAARNRAALSLLRVVNHRSIRSSRQIAPSQNELNNKTKAEQGRIRPFWAIAMMRPLKSAERRRIPSPFIQQDLPNATSPAAISILVNPSGTLRSGFLRVGRDRGNSFSAPWPSETEAGRKRTGSLPKVPQSQLRQSHCSVSLEPQRRVPGARPSLRAE